MAEIIVGQTITTQQYANADNTSLSYYLNAYLFYVDVTLISQDIVNALSKVRIKHRMKCVRSYYSKYNSLHSDISIGDEVKNTKYLPTTAKGQTYDLAEWTGDVPHDSQGNLSIVVKGIWHGYDNNNNYGPVSNTLLNEIQFPQILRASTINVSPTFLTSGNATIMVTKHDPAYTTTLKYRVNNVDYVIATKSSNTTFYLAYNTIKNIIGSYTSAVVKITAITYSGNTILGEDSKEIIIQTGSIPLSLYDDMQGNTGVTLGEEATGAGFNVKMEAQFDKSVKGMAYGLGALPRISSGDDFNNYLTPGMWAVVSNSGAGNITNCPVAIGGILQVFDGRGQYPYTTYLMQRYLPSSISTGNYVRVVRDITTTPVFGNWVIEATMTGSDRKIKKDIRSLTIDYENLFNKLNPITYKYRVSYTRVDDTTHFGFIAQDVEQAINEVGLTDLALINVEDDNYSLNYQEFIALNTHMIQKLYGIVEEQQIKINELENRLEELVNG
jgi:hypothetical protein